MTAFNPSETEINAAIAAGRTVTARQSDVLRKGQPNRGAQVRVTEAFSTDLDGRVRVYAAGYRGRFAVTDVVIEGEATAAELQAEAQS